jgi:hypothetical protein
MVRYHWRKEGGGEGGKSLRVFPDQLVRPFFGGLVDFDSSQNLSIMMLPVWLVVIKILPMWLVVLKLGVILPI